jgi:hypothetical protein
MSHGDTLNGRTLRLPAAEADAETTLFRPARYIGT